MEDMASYFTLRFVLPRGKTEATCSELLNEAFLKCQEQDITPTWINHDDVLLLNPVKQDVFVLDPFEGAAIDHLSRFKCTLVGPRCLLTCLDEGKPVPELPYPMYTAAMRGLIVTSTGFSKEKKARLQMLTERMGGIYANAFHDGVTHLICDIVKSKKYEVAVKKGVPVMTEEWMEKVWEIGKHENVKAGDNRFVRYSCPALKGLAICISQMSRKEKDTLKKKIETYGGIYTPVLDMEKTAILIVTTTEGDKYSYARKWQIPCLSPDWILDSIDQKHCLGTSQYRIDLAKASTPTKDVDSSSVKLQEVSMCSIIMEPGRGDKSSTVRVNETLLPGNMSLLNKDTDGAEFDSGSKSMESLLEKLEISRVKKSGLFLDGCCIFLSGFTEVQETLLSRVLTCAGANRMNQITPSVTHMVIGQKVQEHWDMAQKVRASPYKLFLAWIVESMLLSRPAPEEDFIFTEVLTSGSAVRKSSSKPTVNQATDVPPVTTDEEQQTMYENDLLAQYKNTSSSKANANKDNTLVNQAGTMHDDSQASCTQVSRFLSGKKMALVGMSEDSESDLSEWVSEAGGEIVFRDFDGILDYLIVPPVIFGETDSGFRFKEKYSKLWLEDCLDEGVIITATQYYHHPYCIRDPSFKPCHGIVIGITNYTGHEREFVTALAEALGMVAQEIFAKRDKREAKQSTHLVCDSPEGQKYAAAIKWGLPVVNKDWLLACYKDEVWVSEKTFLVGESTTFTSGKPDPRPEKVAEKKSPAVAFCNVLDESVGDNDGEVKFKTPIQQSTRVREQLDFETPVIDIEKLRPKPINLDISSPTPWVESQPSPQNLKRKCDNDNQGNDGGGNLSFYLHGVKTPNTPYGAFLGGNPTPNTRKIYKKQCMELARYEMGPEELQELERHKAAMKSTTEVREKRIREREGAAQEEFLEHERRMLAPERIKAGHEMVMGLLKKKGIPVLEGPGDNFDELMEAKMQKSGKSWLKPGSSNSNTEAAGGKADKVAGLMQGVVVYVTKKLRHMQDEINGIVASLGGEFCWDYSSNVSHVVFTGQANDRTKEFRQARDDKKRIVAPDWIFMCRDEQRLVEEDAFPHTYNPKMSLSIMVTTSPLTRRDKGRQKMVSQEPSNICEESPLSHVKSKERPCKGNLDENDGMESPSKKARKQCVDLDLSAHLAKLDELVEASTSKETPSTSRRSMRMTLTSTETTPDHVKDGNVGRGNGCGDQATVGMADPSQNLDSQIIQWKDPKEDEERIKLREKLAMETQAMAKVDETQGTQAFQSMELPENLTALMMQDNKENLSTTGSNCQDRVDLNTDDSNVENAKYFMLSSVPDDKRATFMTFLDKHQVRYSNATFCEPDATHIIAQKLSRSEKMLGSIASGKFVLHPSYIDACLAAEHILSEQRYEWGNPENGFMTRSLNEQEQSLAQAAYRWRLTVQQPGKKQCSGAFSGMRAIIHTSNQRVEAFKRLLELGKGKVVMAQPPYSNPLDATHCLAEPSRLPKVRIDMKALASHGVAVVGPVYINEFLTRNPAPKVDEYLVEEFKPFWEKK